MCDMPNPVREHGISQIIKSVVKLPSRRSWYTFFRHIISISNNPRIAPQMIPRPELQKARTGVKKISIIKNVNRLRRIPWKCTRVLRTSQTACTRQFLQNDIQRHKILFESCSLAMYRTEWLNLGPRPTGMLLCLQLKILQVNWLHFCVVFDTDEIIDSKKNIACPKRHLYSPDIQDR